MTEADMPGGMSPAHIPPPLQTPVPAARSTAQTEDVGSEASQRGPC